MENTDGFKTQLHLHLPKLQNIRKPNDSQYSSKYMPEASKSRFLKDVEPPPEEESWQAAAVRFSWILT